MAEAGASAHPCWRLPGLQSLLRYGYPTPRTPKPARLPGQGLPQGGDGEGLFAPDVCDVLSCPNPIGGCSGAEDSRDPR